MNRNDTVLQLAVLLVIIAILGVALLKGHSSVDRFSRGSSPAGEEKTIVIQATKTGDVQEKRISPAVELVTQYFEALQSKNYKEACSLLTRERCSPVQPNAVALFAGEHQKYRDGFESVLIKDGKQKSSLGNDIVCVKYSYRLKNDGNPKKTHEG